MTSCWSVPTNWHEVTEDERKLHVDYVMIFIINQYYFISLKLSMYSPQNSILSLKN